MRDGRTGENSNSFILTDIANIHNCCCFFSDFVSPYIHIYWTTAAVSRVIGEFSARLDFRLLLSIKRDMLIFSSHFYSSSSSCLRHDVFVSSRSFDSLIANSFNIVSGFYQNQSEIFLRSFFHPSLNLMSNGKKDFFVPESRWALSILGSARLMMFTVTRDHCRQRVREICDMSKRFKFINLLSRLCSSGTPFPVSMVRLKLEKERKMQLRWYLCTFNNVWVKCVCLIKGENIITAAELSCDSAGRFGQVVPCIAD